MTTTTNEDEAQLEKAQAEQIIADTPLFEGVRSVTVELGNDFDGDPAMWLIFHLDQTSAQTKIGIRDSVSSTVS